MLSNHLCIHIIIHLDRVVHVCRQSGCCTKKCAQKCAQKCIHNTSKSCNTREREGLLPASVNFFTISQNTDWLETSTILYLFHLYMIHSLPVHGLVLICSKPLPFDFPSGTERRRYSSSGRSLTINGLTIGCTVRVSGCPSSTARADSRG